jgi:hypothetical protein
MRFDGTCWSDSRRRVRRRRQQIRSRCGPRHVISLSCRDRTRMRQNSENGARRRTFGRINHMNAHEKSHSEARAWAPDAGRGGSEGADGDRLKLLPKPAVPAGAWRTRPSSRGRWLAPAGCAQPRCPDPPATLRRSRRVVKFGLLHLTTRSAGALPAPSVRRGARGHPERQLN